MLGENSAPAIFSVNTNTNYSSSDYNGFRPNPGRRVSFQWNSPPLAMRSPIAPACAERPQRPRSARDAPVRDARRLQRRPPHQDQHSVLVDYDVFVNVPKLDAKDLATVQRLYKAEDFDFRLKPGSAAVDRGVVAAERDRWLHGSGARPRRAGSRPDAAALRTAIDGRFLLVATDTNQIKYNSNVFGRLR